MRLLTLLVVLAACASGQPQPAHDPKPTMVSAPLDVDGYHVASTTDQQGPFTNRLANQSSPYLLQHAHNPVDWHPWGDEAFEEARRRGLPVFLSIGYAACHWCHVMEEESFEDPALAAFLNEHFVAIKVDREERPDVDAVYMDAVYRLNGRGGWPASLFLTPDRHVFFAGTYFPRESRLNRMGFLDLLHQLQEQWASGQDGLVAKANSLTAQLRRGGSLGPVAELDWESPAKGVAGLRRGWDEQHKGWGSRKFPMLSRAEFLLSYGVAHTDGPALAQVAELLDAMDRGGIHDQIGGGFHRYTVDPAWRVPHFEKMLYDNGQFLRIYGEAAAALDNPRYRDVAAGVAAYLERDMRDPGGAFYSSEDADSGGEEGTFYVWTPAQVRAEIGGPAAEQFSTAYAISSRGNFEGANVLSRPTADASAPALVAGREALRKARESRVRPPRDDKRVIAYNGLAIGGLARAGRLDGEPHWVELAVGAADACLAARRADGALPRTLEPGAPLGVIDDYAFLAEGLLDLYEASGELRWLVAADDVAAEMTRRFWDDALGGFWFADRAGGPLLVRQKDWSDGARPSGAGRGIAVLSRLRAYGAPSGDAEKLQAGLLAAGATIGRSPASVPSLLETVDWTVRGSMEVVIAVPAGKRELGQPFVDVYNADFRPHAVLAWADASEPQRERFTALNGKVPDGDRAQAYVCFDGVCKQPTSDLTAFGKLIARGG